MNAEQFIKYAATFAGGAYAQHKLTEHQVFRDPEIRAALDTALQDVPESDIERLVNLSPGHLRDWAMAPKAMRPALLKKWESKQSFDETLAGFLREQEREMVRRNPDVLSYDEHGRLHARIHGPLWHMWNIIASSFRRSR